MFSHRCFAIAAVITLPDRRHHTRSFTLSTLFAGALLAAQAFPALSVPLLADSATDLWNGITPTSSSSIHGGATLGGMFGQTGSGEENHTVFADNQAQGSVNFVQWNTASDITLRSFVLHAVHDGIGFNANQRGFSHFELKAFIGGSFQTIFSYDAPALLYGDNAAPANGLLETNAIKNEMYLGVNLSPVVAQLFRAEFTQFGPASSNQSGIRIHELDGFDTFLASAPVPGAVPLPGALPLFASGVAMLGYLGWRRRQRT